MWFFIAPKLINKRRTERNEHRIEFHFSSSLDRLNYLNLVIYKINLFHSSKTTYKRVKSDGSEKKGTFERISRACYKIVILYMK